MKHACKICFIVICVVSCTSKDKTAPFYRKPFEVRLNTVMRQGGKDMVKAYKYAYGLGRNDTNLHWRVNPSLNFALDTFVYDSFFFQLPVNSNADSVTFCLVRLDNKIDTVSLAYDRHFYASELEGYRFNANNLRITGLSSAFLRDSCTINNDDNGYMFYTGNFLTNLKLVLKP